jgi:hypothetical protein
VYASGMPRPTSSTIPSEAGPLGVDRQFGVDEALAASGRPAGAACTCAAPSRTTHVVVRVQHDPGARRHHVGAQPSMAPPAPRSGVRGDDDLARTRDDRLAHSLIALMFAHAAAPGSAAASTTVRWMPLLNASVPPRAPAPRCPGPPRAAVRRAAAGSAPRTSRRCRSRTPASRPRRPAGTGPAVGRLPTPARYRAPAANAARPAAADPGVWWRAA